MIEICCLDVRLRASWYIYIYIHARRGNLVLYHDYNRLLGVGTHGVVGSDTWKWRIPEIQDMLVSLIFLDIRIV